MRGVCAYGEDVWGEKRIGGGYGEGGLVKIYGKNKGGMVVCVCIW